MNEAGTYSPQMWFLYACVPAARGVLLLLWAFLSYPGDAICLHAWQNSIGITWASQYPCPLEINGSWTPVPYCRYTQNTQILTEMLKTFGTLITLYHVTTMCPVCVAGPSQNVFMNFYWILLFKTIICHAVQHNPSKSYLNLHRRVSSRCVIILMKIL